MNIIIALKGRNYTKLYKLKIVKLNVRAMVKYKTCSYKPDSILLLVYVIINIYIIIIYNTGGQKKIYVSCRIYNNFCRVI